MKRGFAGPIALVASSMSLMIAQPRADDGLVWALSGNWAVTYGKSTMDDSRSVVLSSRSEELIPGQLDGAAPAALKIVCQEHKTTVLLTFNGSFMSSAGNYGRVEYRIDNDKSQATNLSATADNGALGLAGPSAIHFAQSLFGTDQLLVRAMSFDGSLIEVTFPTKGLEMAVKPLRRACGW